LITDPYPDYERVIPVELNKEMIINKADFISAVKRVSLFSNPMTNQVRLKMGNNVVTIYAQDIDFGGEAHEDVKCHYEEEELEINYNANYFMDLLRHLDSDEIVFKLDDPDGPGIILPKEQENDIDMLMLIMPVRVNS